MDLLNIKPLSMNELNAISILGLAHMGDAVYEILVRTALILQGDATSAHLHRDTTAIVCAPAQANAVDIILPELNEEETAIYRRGRNANVHNIPKNASHSQYAKATGLEALFGALYLLGRTQRIQQLFTLIWEDHNAA